MNPAGPEPTTDDTGPPATPRLRALARLASTRARLRAQVLPARRSGAVSDEDDGLAGAGQALRTWWRFLRRQLGHTPVGLAVLSWLENWWQRQPLAAAAEMGATELRATVLPLVRRHPLAAMASAALVGGALVASRRWLWAWAGRRARVWPAAMGSWVWHQARDPAIQLLLMAWLQRLMASRPEAAEAPGAPAPAPAHPAEPQA